MGYVELIEGNLDCWRAMLDANGENPLRLAVHTLIFRFSLSSRAAIKGLKSSIYVR